MDPYHIYSRFKYRFGLYLFILLAISSGYGFFSMPTMMFSLFGSMFLHCDEPKNVIWITDYDNFNEELSLKVLKGLMKNKVINLKAVIVNDEEAALKVRKDLGNKKIQIAISNKKKLSSNNLQKQHESNIDIIPGYLLINNILVDNFCTIICTGDITPLHYIIESKTNLAYLNNIDRIYIAQDVEVINKRLYPNTNDFRVKKVFEALQDWIPFVIMGKYALNQMIITDKDLEEKLKDVPFSTFIYNPALIVSLTRPDLFKGKFVNMHKLIGVSKDVKPITLPYHLKKYIMYWL